PTLTSKKEDLMEGSAQSGTETLTANVIGHDSSSSLTASALNPQSCPTCGTTKPAESGSVKNPAYVYALGRIGPRFPTAAIEKEFSQVVGRSDTKDLTNPEVLHKILTDRHNRYLVRKLCWVMTIEGLETYILVPRDPADFDLLVETLRARPKGTDLD